MLWNPWRGCHRCSEGCKFCYIHKGDRKKGIDTSLITLTKDFDKPLIKNQKGEYKLKGTSIVYVCFSSDFLIEEADPWRLECYQMIKQRSDLQFLFLTKRIDRFMEVLPKDWGIGYDNVTVGVSVENQSSVDYKLNIFKELPIKHKNIICQPLIERVNIEPYLEGVELVVVGGESDPNGRVLNYDWVLDIKRQCYDHQVSFSFRQCATHFIKDDRLYHLYTKTLSSQAKKAAIDHYF